jgi:hypothetical protein
MRLPDNVDKLPTTPPGHYTGYGRGLVWRIRQLEGRWIAVANGTTSKCRLCDYENAPTLAMVAEKIKTP